MAAPEFQVAFGNAIKAVRSQLRLSQEELAHRAGLHRTYISDVERGARNLSLQNIEKLAQALELSVTTLFAKTDSTVDQNHSVEILLVEDDARDAELTTRAFRKARITNPLRIVPDGIQAVDWLFGPDSHSLPGLILLDLNLPGIGGIEILRRIKADRRTRPIPVIVLTASDHDADIVACRDLGVENYIVKPVGFRALSEVTPHLRLDWTLGLPARNSGSGKPRR